MASCPDPEAQGRGETTIPAADVVACQQGETQKYMATLGHSNIRAVGYINRDTGAEVSQASVSCLLAVAAEPASALNGHARGYICTSSLVVLGTSGLRPVLAR